MSWKKLFAREENRRTTDRHEQHGADQVLMEPREVLHAHRLRLNALRLESGYDSEQFEKLIGFVLQQASDWVHGLAATRAEHHSEAGGLLRLALESACLAFRRADGKFLAAVGPSDVRNRERDRVWRYAALLGALLRPLGRCVTHVRASSADSRQTWNALHEPLWTWQRRVEARRIEVQWRDAIDGRSTAVASAWIAGRIIPPAAIAYLQSAEESLPEIVLRIIAGERNSGLCEIVEAAYQAAVDQDLARRDSSEGGVQAGVQIEHRLLEALRALCREKWTLNTPGGRLWCTDSGVYLVWKAAANDIVLRMRAQGISGAPQDPDTLAELLSAHGVLAPNPQISAGLKHYYKLVPQMRGVPKQGLEVVKIANAELVGLQLQGMDRIPAEVNDTSGNPAPIVTPLVPEPQALELPLRAPGLESVAELAVSPARLTPPPLPPPARAEHRSPVSKVSTDLERLKRFGAPGDILHKLAEQASRDPCSVAVASVGEGLAVAFPDAIASFCPDPREFLTACETQGLLVPETPGGRRYVRKRALDQSHLPAQYIVLAPRIARHFPLPAGQGV